MTPRARTVAFVAAAAGCLALAIGAQMLRDARMPLRERAVTRTLFVPTGPALARLALSFDAIAADVYWIRALQHYGGERLGADHPGRYELLDPLLQATTTLDPYFTLAYRFGAIFLSEGGAGGPGRSDSAIALLEKGIAAEPHKWQYFHDIGFVEFWSRKNPAEAARWFQRAAEQPGAPNWLEPLAAAVLGEHDRASARLLWQRILQSDEAWMRRSAERSLLQLDALDEIDRIEALVTRARADGAIDLTWPGLVRRGVLPGVPLDPTGVPLAIDPATGIVSVGPASKLNPMPDLSRARR